MIKLFRKIFVTAIFSIFFFTITSLADWVAVGNWEQQEDGRWKFYETTYKYYLYKKNSGSYWIDSDNDGIAKMYYFDENGYLLVNCLSPIGIWINANGELTNNIDGTPLTVPVSTILAENATKKAQEDALKAQQEAQRAQANNSSANTKSRLYTSDEIFAMADNYLSGVPNPRRYRALDLGIGGAFADYYTDRGIYSVVFTRDFGNMIIFGDMEFSHYIDNLVFSRAYYN